MISGSSNNTLANPAGLLSQLASESPKANKPKCINSLEDLEGADLSEVEVIFLTNMESINFPDDFNPPRLKVMDLKGSKIESLPDEFNPPELEELNLSNTQIASLPDIFNPPNLKKLLMSRTSISSFPHGFNPPKLEELFASNTEVSFLPDGFTPPLLKKLSLAHTKLTHLPNGFKPLNLEFLTLAGSKITFLPDGFNPPKLETLALAYSKILSFPEGFNPPNLKFLNLNTAPITSFPNGFNPPLLETLNMPLSQIRSFPEGFNPPHLRSVDLSHSSITSLPYGFCPPNLRTLSLRQCSNLNSLPEAILDLSNRCMVILSLPNLCQRAQRSLRENTARDSYNGPRFEFDMTVGYKRAESKSPLTAMQKLLAHAKDHSNPNDLLDKLSESASSSRQVCSYIHTWLDRLFWSASAKAENKEAFFKSIVENLKTVSTDDELRSFFQDLVAGTTSTCGDGITLSTLHLANHVKSKTMSVDDAKAVYDFLVRTVYAMDILHKTADNIIPTLSLTDPVEVYLGLPFKLKGEFDIDINIDEMLYFRCSGLTDTHLDQARDILREALDDKDKVLSFLMDQPKWIELIRHKFSDQYEAIEKKRFNDATNPSTALQGEQIYKRALKELSKQVIPIKTSS